MSRLQTDELLDRQDELLEDLEDEIGVHLIDDVSSWLGTDITIAILDLDTDVPEWVLLAQISDRDAAFNFVEDLSDYVEDEFRTDADADSYRGADILVFEDESMAIGLTDKYLLFSDGENTLKGMIRNLEAPPSRPLAEMDAFITAQQSVPAKRVAFLFVQTEEIVDSLAESIDPFGDQHTTMQQIRRNVPDYAAGAISFVEEGIRLDFVAETPSEVLEFLSSDSEPTLRSPKAVPEDTLALFSHADIKGIWDLIMETLEDTDPTVAEDIERAMQDFEYETGIDVEEDLLEPLTGELAIALLFSSLDFTALEFGDSIIQDDVGRIDALLLLGVDDGERVEQTFDDFAAIMKDEGAQFYRNRLGDYTAMTVDMSDLLDEGYRLEPGYMVTEDWALIGTTFESMETFYDVMTGTTDSLGSEVKFQRVTDLIDDPIHELVYINVAGVMETVEDALDSETRSNYRRDVKPFVEPLDIFLLATSTTATEVRVTTILTLLE